MPFAREQAGIGFLFCPLFPIALFVMEEESCGCESLMRNAPDAKEPVFIQEAVSTVGLAVEKVLYLRNRQLIRG